MNIKLCATAKIHPGHSCVPTALKKKEKKKEIYIHTLGEEDGGREKERK